VTFDEHYNFSKSTKARHTDIFETCSQMGYVAVMNIIWSMGYIDRFDLSEFKKSCKSEHINVVKWYINVNNIPLYNLYEGLNICCLYSRVENANYILQYCKEHNNNTNQTIPYKVFREAIMKCCNSGSIEIAKMMYPGALLGIHKMQQHVVDSSWIKKNKSFINKAFMTSCRFKRFKMSQWLLSKGADIYLYLVNVDSELDPAKIYAHELYVDLFLEHGVNTNYVTKDTSSEILRMMFCDRYRGTSFRVLKKYVCNDVNNLICSYVGENSKFETRLSVEKLLILLQ